MEKHPLKALNPLYILQMLLSKATYIAFKLYGNTLV